MAAASQKKHLKLLPSLTCLYHWWPLGAAESQFEVKEKHFTCKKGKYFSLIFPHRVCFLPVHSLTRKSFCLMENFWPQIVFIFFFYIYGKSQCQLLFMNLLPKSWKNRKPFKSSPTFVQTFSILCISCINEMGAGCCGQKCAAVCIFTLFKPTRRVFCSEPEPLQNVYGSAVLQTTSLTLKTAVIRCSFCQTKMVKAPNRHFRFSMSWSNMSSLFGPPSEQLLTLRFWIWVKKWETEIWTRCCSVFA